MASSPVPAATSSHRLWDQRSSRLPTVAVLTQVCHRVLLVTEVFHTLVSKGSSSSLQLYCVLDPKYSANDCRPVMHIFHMGFTIPNLEDVQSKASV